MEEEEDNKRIILASSSPRRKRILEQLHLDFEIIEPSKSVEKLFKNPYETVSYNSLAKVKNIYNHAIINNLNYRNALIAGFDTIVYCRGRFFGKPLDIKMARDFLTSLSGKSHSVISSVSVLNFNSGSFLSDSDITVVKFRKLDKAEIEKYLEIEYVSDKAGAYDIMGFGSILIEKINGCFYNVAGLPVGKFIGLMKKFNYKIL
ncbi:MAG: Maf family protein [Actinobacteria bacterium]|nr:Maf family protein [Actinomycetota bacterium]